MVEGGTWARERVVCKHQTSFLLSLKADQIKNRFQTSLAKKTWSHIQAAEEKRTIPPRQESTSVAQCSGVNGACVVGEPELLPKGYLDLSSITKGQTEIGAEGAPLLGCTSFPFTKGRGQKFSFSATIPAKRDDGSPSQPEAMRRMRVGRMRAEMRL